MAQSIINAKMARCPCGSTHVSHVAQNYLLCLYIMKEQGIRATPAHIADYIRQIPATERLGASLPSVVGMIRRMVKEGFVEISEKKDVLLTRIGGVYAEQMVRRHRLAERMVVDLLNLDLAKAHVEAHQLEHAMSPELESKIRERLGNPTTSPFGHPIPGSGYKEPKGDLTTLEKAMPKQSYLIERIPEDDQELLRFFIQHNIVPGQGIEVIESGRYRGVVSFQTTVGETSIGYEAAKNIWIVTPDD